MPGPNLRVSERWSADSEEAHGGALARCKALGGERADDLRELRAFLIHIELVTVAIDDGSHRGSSAGEDS